MRRTILAAAAAAALLAAGCGSDDNDALADSATEAEDAGPAAHEHEPGSDTFEVSPEIAAEIAAIRAGTATYANDLDAALQDGFFPITQHIDDMGHHFLNPAVEGFDINEPPILVYGRDGDDWELVAVEWVFPEEPAEPPMEGATYGDFPAACHYDDGLFEGEPVEENCPETHPESDAAFTFWHPDLVTFHAWAWMHNPDGLYHGTNPLMSPYNE
ncbi:MAG: hypothetical protein ACRDWI_04690 [Jiangellaceae bacterium]